MEERGDVELEKHALPQRGVQLSGRSLKSAINTCTEPTTKYVKGQKEG